MGSKDATQTIPSLGETEDEQESLASSVLTYMKTLDRLQKQHATYVKKVEFEKQKKAYIEQKLEEYKAAYRLLQNKTMNGVINSELEKEHKKQIHLFEQQLESAKIKLGLQRKENAALKDKIDYLRKEKNFQLHLIAEMTTEADELKHQFKQFQKEVARINSAKHATDSAIANYKHKIIREADEFTKEVDKSREEIHATNESMLDAIKERVQYIMEYSTMRDKNLSTKSIGGTRMTKLSQNLQNKEDRIAQPNDLLEIFDELGVTSIDELMAALERSEEHVFSLYNEIQNKSDEWETIELEKKNLERQLAVQEDNMKALEKHNSEMRNAVEAEITQIRQAIDRRLPEYIRNKIIFDSMTDGLTLVVKNLAIDDEPTDQQLMYTGVTENNVEDFLSLAEQRIDELIQMSAAAAKQPLRREELFKHDAHTLMRKVDGGFVVKPPVLPAIGDDEDDESGQGIGDDLARVQPVNIASLKDTMKKKAIKNIMLKKTGEKYI